MANTNTNISIGENGNLFYSASVLRKMFREVYPKGVILLTKPEPTSFDKTNGEYVCEAKVFDDDKNLLANGFACKATSENISGYKWAQTAAVVTALENAGFVQPFLSEQEKAKLIAEKDKDLKAAEEIAKASAAEPVEEPKAEIKEVPAEKPEPLQGQTSVKEEVPIKEEESAEAPAEPVEEQKTETKEISEEPAAETAPVEEQESEAEEDAEEPVAESKPVEEQEDVKEAAESSEEPIEKPEAVEEEVAEEQGASIEETSESKAEEASEQASSAEGESKPYPSSEDVRRMIDEACAKGEAFIKKALADDTSQEDALELYKKAAQIDADCAVTFTSETTQRHRSTNVEKKFRELVKEASNSIKGAKGLDLTGVSLVYGGGNPDETSKKTELKQEAEVPKEAEPKATEPKKEKLSRTPTVPQSVVAKYIKGIPAPDDDAVSDEDKIEAYKGVVVNIGNTTSPDSSKTMEWVFDMMKQQQPAAKRIKRFYLTSSDGHRKAIGDIMRWLITKGWKGVSVDELNIE